MKKLYEQPSIKMSQYLASMVMAASGIVGAINDNIEIGYGGMDEEGEFNPSAKEHHFSPWDGY